MNTVFFDAIKQGELAAVKVMLATKPALSKMRDENGLSPILIATYYGQTKIIDLLLAHSDQLDIFEAAATGQLKLVLDELERKPDVINSYNVDGFQPLGLACFFGHIEVANTLLAKGAEVDQLSKNKMKVAPLNSAAAGNHFDIAKMLLESGADPNIRQTGGFTPLHSAAQNGDLAMIRMLLEFGADPSAASDDGKLPADMVPESGRQAAVRALLTSR